MARFETEYARMIQKVLSLGEVRVGRNGETTSYFGMSITIHIGGFMPLLQSRRMYTRGIFGEFAAMVRQPKHVDDFKKWGCNYWDKWAAEDGSINVDYGNAWFDFNGTDQVAKLKEALKNNPTDRRMIINAWRPDRLDELSLPCCHYNYQFYVSSDNVISMIWTQRSVDMMLGLPSDFILAAIWLITLAREFGFTPGHVKFDLGDCHVYKEHYANAKEYIHRVVTNHSAKPVRYHLNTEVGTPFESFKPADITLGVHNNAEPLTFELKD